MKYFLTLISGQMDVLEQKYSPRGLAADLRSPSSLSSLFSSPSTPSSLQRRCRPAKSVLLETEAKGTLVERVQRLEERISQVNDWLIAGLNPAFMYSRLKQTAAFAYF